MKDRDSSVESSTILHTTTRSFKFPGSLPLVRPTGQRLTTLFAKYIRRSDPLKSGTHYRSPTDNMCVAFWSLASSEYALCVRFFLLPHPVFDVTNVSPSFKKMALAHTCSILCTNRDEFLDRPTAPAHFHAFGNNNTVGTSCPSLIWISL